MYHKLSISFLLLFILSSCTILTYYVQQNKDQEQIPALEIKRVEVADIFASQAQRFHHYPLGFISLKNASNQTIDELTVQTFTKDLMDNPKNSRIIKDLKPQQIIEVQIYGSFNQQMLQIAEDQIMNLEIKLYFRSKEKKYTKQFDHPVNLFQKNAFTWDSPEKLGVFITSKEDSVKTFTRKSIDNINKNPLTSFDPILLNSLQIFIALKQYGIQYASDPKTPFQDFYKNKKKIDYVQFPHEVLQYKAGDCDDLSVLIASLFENIGIKTAFIITENHILIMFDTEVPIYKKNVLLYPEKMLIAHNGSFWVPLETTLLKDSFLVAWEQGLKTYQDTIIDKKSTALIMETQSIWKEYAPINITAHKPLNYQPDLIQLQNAVSKEGEQIAFYLIDLQKKELENERKTTYQANKIGVLYARFGLYKQAGDYFKAALALNNKYPPALFNLGNTYLLQKEFDKALALYLQIQKNSPEDPDIKYALNNLLKESAEPLIKEKISKILSSSEHKKTAINSNDKTDTKAEKNQNMRIQWIIQK